MGAQSDFRAWLKDRLMTTVSSIEHDFRKSVASEVELAAEGANQFRVFVPFGFDDGDHFVIVLKQERGEWLLSDEAHTYMHLSYDVDIDELRSGPRAELNAMALAASGIRDRDGELVLPVRDGEYGYALFSFVQALIRIADGSYLSRQFVPSAFVDEFRTLMAEAASHSRAQFAWHDAERDPDGNYKIDCRIETGLRPLLVQALTNDRSVRDATITFLKLAQWDAPFDPVGVFEDRDEISAPVLARFSEVCPTQFPDITTHREQIANHIRRRLARQRPSRDAAD